MHSDAPTAPLYEPASQAVQATPSATPVYPRLHLQSVRLLLPAGDEECVGHAKHKSGSCAPITSEYDATGQGVQRIAASVSAYLPASQSSHELEPATSEKEPRWQSKQNSGEAAAG